MNNSKSISKIELNTGYSCNSYCRFCTAGLEKRKDNPSFAELRKKIADSIKHNVDSIVFNGGEPTIRRDLLKLVDAAKKEGYKEVEIQSNGFLLSKKEYVKRLVSLGVTKFYVSIHSHNAATQDMLTNTPGSFRLTTEGIRNIINENADIEIVCVIQKANVNHLLEFVKFFSSMGVKKFKFYFINIEGRVTGNYAELVPKISYAAKMINECYESAKGTGIEKFEVQFIPYCLMGKNHQIVFNPRIKKYAMYDTRMELLLENSKFDQGIKLEKCKECKMMDICCGISQNYIKFFGDSEIIPIKKNGCA